MVLFIFIINCFINKIYYKILLLIVFFTKYPLYCVHKGFVNIGKKTLEQLFEPWLTT